MPQDGSMVSIGELTRATGLPVRTIRFSCDEGIVQAHRSQGGHRLFDEDARNQLVPIRRIRALGTAAPDQREARLGLLATAQDGRAAREL